MNVFVKILTIVATLSNAICCSMALNNTSEIKTLNKNLAEDIKEKLRLASAPNVDYKQIRGYFLKLAMQLKEEISGEVGKIQGGNDPVKLMERARKQATEFYRTVFPKGIFRENPYYIIAQQAIENGDYEYNGDATLGSHASFKYVIPAFKISPNLQGYCKDIQFINSFNILSKDLERGQTLDVFCESVIKDLRAQERKDKDELETMVLETENFTEQDDEFSGFVNTMLDRSSKIIHWKGSAEFFGSLTEKIVSGVQTEEILQCLAEHLRSMLPKATDFYKKAREIVRESVETYKNDIKNYEELECKAMQEVFQNPNKILDYMQIRIVPDDRIQPQAIVHETGHILHSCLLCVLQKEPDDDFYYILEGVSIFFELYYAHLNTDQEIYRFIKKERLHDVCVLCAGGYISSVGTTIVENALPLEAVRKNPYAIAVYNAVKEIKSIDESPWWWKKTAYTAMKEIACPVGGGKPLTVDQVYELIDWLLNDD